MTTDWKDTLPPRGQRLIAWLEESTGQTLRDPSATPPKTNDRHLSVRIPGDVYAHLEQLSAETGHSLSDVVRELISDGLDATAMEARRRDMGIPEIVDVPRGDRERSYAYALELISTAMGILVEVKTTFPTGAGHQLERPK